MDPTFYHAFTFAGSPGRSLNMRSLGRVFKHLGRDPASVNAIKKFRFVASFEMILSNKGITEVLIRLCEGAGWSVPLFLKTPEDMFTHAEAHILCDSIKEINFKY